ncbi:MAG: hypothetical protein J0I41_07455 [Filimonas sp.]|nr:hypothetical protein [Filimonas sp.]
MKRILALILTFFTITILHAQKKRGEYWIDAGSGLFHFSGDIANPSSTLLYTPYFFKGYAGTYGSKSNGLGWSIATTAQAILENNVVWGIGVGYEHFSAKSTVVDGVYIPVQANGLPAPERQIKADGKSTIAFNFINIFPYIGYRLEYKKIKVDLTVGGEIGFVTRQSGRITTDAEVAGHIDTATILNRAKTDYRLRPQLRVSYERMSLYMGYSLGIRNYMDNNADYNARSRIFRLGIGYNIYGPIIRKIWSGFKL